MVSEQVGQTVSLPGGRLQRSAPGALEKFEPIPQVLHPLAPLMDVGLARIGFDPFHRAAPAPVNAPKPHSNRLPRVPLQLPALNPLTAGFDRGAGFFHRRLGAGGVGGVAVPLEDPPPGLHRFARQSVAVGEGLQRLQLHLPIAGGREGAGGVPVAVPFLPVDRLWQLVAQEP